MELTIQMHAEGAWNDCATLRLSHPERGTRGPARLTYRQAHAETWMFRDDIRACSPGGTFDWHAIARELGDLAPPDRLVHELEQLAGRLVGLVDRLEHRGVPQRILTAASVGLAHLEVRFERWGLT